MREGSDMAGKPTSLSSLGDLLRAQGFEASPNSEPSDVVVERVELGFDDTIVLRKERKGRGGKTVTTIQGVHGDKASINDLVRTIKRRLGCGGRTDGALIVIQGDCREQLAVLLQERGAGQIRIS